MNVAVDVGGTFTDFVFVRGDGSIGYFKILSTPRSPEVAVLEGLKSIGGVGEVVHATTIATNALRGQVGLELPKVALVTTRGFRDVIEIGRQNRPRLYDLFFEKPRPLVPRRFRFEVDERVDARGSLLKPVDLKVVEALGSKLGEYGVESAAVVFLHSYINPANERVVEEVLSKFIPYVSPSYRVSPEPREFERASTTVVNATLMPIVSKYLARLLDGLRGLGAKGLYVMSSSGGLVDVEEATLRPVQLVESGPAAGVVAAAEFSRLLGVSKAISFDMGGTTAKAGTIVGYEFELTSEYEVGGEAHHGRVVKGSGYPVRFTFVDLAEVSAGGGTIIWRDEAGALRVGPLSAGADPGPACYGRGGVEPTLTDANLVLDRIGEYMLGGSMKLQRELSVKALSKLGDPEAVASEALQLANLEMARAVRLVTVERGLDPSEFTLIAFGGAGPQHAVFIAEELGIGRVVIPPYPGVFSALGLLMADWRFEARVAYPEDLEDSYTRLEEGFSKRLGRIDYFVRYADVRYEGQGWELTVPIARPARFEDVERVFEEKHLSTFGFKLDAPVEVVLIRVIAVIRRLKPKLKAPPLRGEPKVRSYRDVNFGGSRVKAPAYLRDEMPAGFTVEGPAVVEEYDSTTLIPEGWKAHVGGLGELSVERVA